MMRVEIPVHLFDDDDCFEPLLKLILFFRDTKHEWVLSPLDVDIVSGFFERNFSDARAQSYRRVVEKASMAGVTWASEQDRRPVLRIAKDTLEEDLGDLHRPAVLIVENSTYDWMFISAVAGLLGAEDVLRAEQSDLLDVRDGGGADGAVSQALHQVRRFGRTKRVTLVIDSDRFRPGERTKNHAGAEDVVREGGRTHVLEFRELENYVPNRVLARRRGPADMAKRLESLKKLTHEQRAHFDMKFGFRGKKSSPQTGMKPRHAENPRPGYSVPAQHGGLYEGVSEEDTVVLREGFGKDLSQFFLKEVEAGGISEKDLDGLGPGATEELRSMLGKIRDVI